MDKQQKPNTLIEDVREFLTEIQNVEPSTSPEDFILQMRNGGYHDSEIASYLRGQLYLGSLSPKQKNYIRQTLSTLLQWEKSS